MPRPPRELLLTPPRPGHRYAFGRRLGDPPGIWLAAAPGPSAERLAWAKLQEQIAQQLRDLQHAPVNMRETLAGWCRRRGLDYSTISLMVNGKRWMQPHLLQTISEAIRSTPRAAQLVVPYPAWPQKADTAEPENYFMSDPYLVGMVEPMDDWREPIAANAAKYGAMGRQEFAALRPRIREAAAQLVATRTHFAHTRTLKLRQLGRNHAISPVAGMLSDDEQFLEIFLPGNWAEQIAQIGSDTLPDGRFIVQICHWDDKGIPIAVHVLDLLPWSEVSTEEFEYLDVYESLG